MPEREYNTHTKMVFFEVPFFILHFNYTTHASAMIMVVHTLLSDFVFPENGKYSQFDLFCLYSRIVFESFLIHSNERRMPMAPFILELESFISIIQFHPYQNINVNNYNEYKFYKYMSHHSIPSHLNSIPIPNKIYVHWTSIPSFS